MKYLFSTLSSTNNLLLAVILEEIIHIIFNGYSNSSSLLIKERVTDLFKNILREKEDHSKFLANYMKNLISKYSCVDLIKSVGLNFLEKDIDSFIYSLIRISELKEFTILSKKSKSELCEETKHYYKDIKQILVNIADTVIFYQLILDFLVTFDKDPGSSLHQWDTAEILFKDNFKLFYKVSYLKEMKNSRTDFIEVIAQDISGGNFKFPDHFAGKHSLRTRERNKPKKISFTEWIMTLLTSFANENNNYAYSSRKMYLIFRAFLEHYRIQFNIAKIFESVFFKYDINILPEIGDSPSSPLMKLHTGIRNEKGNFFMWVQVHDKKNAEAESLLRQFTTISFSTTNINPVYVQCLNNLPPNMMTFIPTINNDRNFLVQKLKDINFKHSNMFLNTVFENRRYTFYTRNILMSTLPTGLRKQEYSQERLFIV